MDAIIRRQTSEGVNVAKLRDVQMVRQSKMLDGLSNGWIETIDIRTSEMAKYAFMSIKLDGKTQIILEGS